MTFSEIRLDTYNIIPRHCLNLFAVDFKELFSNSDHNRLLKKNKIK
jgi:hypothetical protein